MSDPQPTPAPPVIEMTAVDVPLARKPSVLSIKQVNWRVAAGDYWVVAGLESTGKSNLMLMTGGLLSPAGGTYRLFGEPMPIFEGERLSTRLRLGLVFDDGRLFNHLTVAENVALPLQYHRDLSNAEAGKAVSEILELTELLPQANNRPGALAWGWQKRAALARSIASRPEVLLLDDPLRGLDARHAAWWMNFLDKLSAGCEFTQGRPMTLVVTTGALDLWKNRARQFALLKHGQFTVLGSREQLATAAGEASEDFLSGTASI